MICGYGTPVNNVVLLKTHCTGGNALANILYRYGDLNELNFALPKHQSYEYFWPLHFHTSFVDANFLNSTLPNMLLNARYSDETMKTLMKVSLWVLILLFWVIGPDSSKSFEIDFGVRMIFQRLQTFVSTCGIAGFQTEKDCAHCNVIDYN